MITTLRMGGAERVCSILADRFAQEHDSTILRFEDEKPFYQVQKASLKTLKFCSKIDKIIALRNFIKQGKFDLIISFLDTTNITVLMANFALKTPVIISEHTSYKLVKGTIWGGLKRVFYPLANGLSVLSREDLDYYTFVKNRAVIYNPIFWADVKECAKENLIIFVGRLEIVKGCDIFLQALSLIDKNLLKSWRVQIAGDGSQKQELLGLKDRLNLDVEFLGNVADMGKLYQKSAIIISSSRIEGLGNALIEAIFYDVVRVATDTSGARELIKSGFDGEICPDCASLASAISSLMKDENLRLKYSLNASLRRDEFRLESIYKKWLNLVENGVS